MPSVTNNLRCDEVRYALAQKTIRTIQENISKEARQVLGESLLYITPERFKDGYFKFTSSEGIAVYLKSPRLRELFEILDQQTESLRPKEPVVEEILEQRIKRGRKFIEGLRRTRAGENVLASINISLGQARRHAISQGIIRKGEPLNEETIHRIAERNGLLTSLNTVPDNILAKVRRNEKLTEVDIVSAALNRELISV